MQQLDGNNIGLSYIQQSGDTSAITSGQQYGGDRYTGLDRHDRVIDQNWVLNPTPASTPTPTPTPTPVSTDRTQLGYDAGSNVLYSNNLLNPSESALYHSSSTTAGDNNSAYDPLSRESNFLRGTLSASGNNTYSSASLDTISNANINTAAGSDQSYALDALGDWTSSGTAAGTGTSTAPTLTSTTRTNNSQNEVTAVGSASLVFDNNGNTTTDQNGDQLSYDAWGHIATDITPTNHETIYTTNPVGNRVSEQDTAGTSSGPVLIVNNGSIQRSMVDSLTVVFPSSVTLSSGAITLYNVTTSSSESMSYSNPSGDGKTWLVTFTGSDIIGGSLPNAVYNLVVHHADVSGITMSSDVTYAFHRLFGDINGDKTVNSTDTAAFNTALAGQYDPAFDYNADGVVNAFDSLKYSHDLGTTYSYTASGAFMVGPSTTAPLSSTDISSWSAGTNDMYYSGNNVIEERQAGSSGASRQEVWGLGYVNSLIEQDTATALDSGGVLPTSHFLQYALDTSFNSTGTLVAGTGSYDSVAIQPNGQVVVAGVSGSNLVVVRYNPNGSVDNAFGTSGYVTIAETSPSFAKLAIDSSGNIDVAVNSGSNVEVYQLSGANGSTNWSTALTFATGVIPQGLAIDSSGKIVVAGDSSSGTGIYVARLTSSGSVDTSFGSSGYVNAPLSGAPSANAIALDSSGKILVAGSDSGDFSVVRLSSSGSVDTTFGTSGEAKVDMGGTDTAYAVAPGPGGTIVAAGVSVQGGSNYDALIRLTSGGSLDTAFNSTGKILGSSGSGTIRAILVQTNGEILAGGDAGSGTAQKVWMFTPAGAADTAFATGGTLTANSGATVFGWAVASGATQRIVVAGSYGGDAALAAFAPASLRLYAQQDAIYNVTAMVDSNGNVVQRYLYDPYGNMTVLSATWTPQSDLFDTQVGFQGMWLDAASGLYHTPFRDYSVALGRWFEQDGGYWDGNNLYQALDGRPTSVTDADGLAPTLDLSQSYGMVQGVGPDSGVPIYAEAGGTGRYYYYSTQDHEYFQYSPSDPQERAYYDSLALSADEIQALNNARSTNVNCMQYATAGATLFTQHQIPLGNVPSATSGMQAGLLSPAVAKTATALGQGLYAPGEENLFRQVLDAQIRVVGGRMIQSADEAVPAGMHEIVAYAYLSAVGWDYHFIVKTAAGRWIGKAGSAPCVRETTPASELNGLWSKRLIAAWFVPGAPPIDPIEVAIKLRRLQLIVLHQLQAARDVTATSTSVYPPQP